MSLCYYGSNVNVLFVSFVYHAKATRAKHPGPPPLFGILLAPCTRTTPPLPRASLSPPPLLPPSRENIVPPRLPPPPPLLPLRHSNIFHSHSSSHSHPCSLAWPPRSTQTAPPDSSPLLSPRGKVTPRFPLSFFLHLPRPAPSSAWRESSFSDRTAIATGGRETIYPTRSPTKMRRMTGREEGAT